MKYSDWFETVPKDIREDTLWRIEAYRIALFAADVAWADVTKLFRDARTVQLAGQLIDSVGSIGANISEGYSRASHKDQARFYEYALGSARESRSWYYNARHVLGTAAAEHRIQLQTQIIRLLLSIVPSIRGYSLHEAAVEYSCHLDDSSPAALNLTRLLEVVPQAADPECSATG